MYLLVGGGKGGDLGGMGGVAHGRRSACMGGRVVAVATNNREVRASRQTTRHVVVIPAKSAMGRLALGFALSATAISQRSALLLAWALFFVLAL